MEETTVKSKKALAALWDAVAGLLRASYFSLFLTINVAFMVLLIAYYLMESYYSRDHGITTEIAVIFTYLIGALIALDIFPIQLILAMTVVLLLVLSRKEKIKTLVRGIQRGEINAFISYAIIALVILPFLPNRPFFLSDIPGLGVILAPYNLDLGRLAQIEILNPFRLWFIVALITGVDLAGYALQRTIGQKKGWLLTSIAGGFVSSTATTQSLAQKSQKSGFINLLVAAAVFSNMASFFQIFVLIAPLNGQFLAKSTPLILSLIISAFSVGLFFLKVKKAGDQEDILETKERLKKGEIFSLGPALKFALIFLAIRIVTKLSLVFFGSGGFLATSAIASIAGLDAVIINLAEMAGKIINFQTGVLALILANATNLLSKTVYSFVQGKKEFALKFALSATIIIFASLFGLIPFYSP
jgi:uncharacterized membrane protein (DUF4010 family)